METFGQRLMIAMDKEGVNQSELAKLIGISQPSVQYLCKTGSGSKHLTKIAKALNVNADWLATGAGSSEACNEKAPPVIDAVEWRGLSPKVRLFVEDMIEKYKEKKITDNDITFLHLMADKFSTDKHVHA